jgi:hypothetical protein
MAATLKTRIEAHIVILRKRAEEMIAEANALEAALNDQPTEGQLAKQLLDFFVEHWEKQHKGRKYVVNGAKDMATFKRLLKTLDARSIAKRTKTYLYNLSNDKFLVENGHSIGMFASRINSIRGDVAPSDFTVAPPVGCKHQPPCASDQVHTAKAMKEARS